MSTTMKPVGGRSGDQLNINLRQSSMELPSGIQQAIEKAVAEAVLQLTDRITKSENDWKSEASAMLGNIAKNRRYVEDFVGKQGDYVAKLNGFADDFRMELDAKFEKGVSSKRVVSEVLCEQDLPSEYYWRLERIEKQVGTHRYLEKNKEARSINERLTALENATGILTGTDAYVDGNAWGNFQSVPMSNLRVFSREVGSSRGRSMRSHNIWDGNSRSTAPNGPKSSSSRSPRPVTTGGEFPALSTAEENQSASERNTNTAPATVSKDAGGTIHHFEGIEATGNVLPTSIPSNAPPGTAALFVASTLQDMNTLMKIERESKSDLQNQLAELTFELDRKALADEEMRRQVEELTAANKEALIKESMLQQQKERIGETLLQMQAQLRAMEERIENEKAAAVEHSLETHPAVVSLKKQVQDMQEELTATKHNNGEYQKSIKELMKFTKEVEAKRTAAIDEKKHMQELLLEAKKQLMEMQERELASPQQKPAEKTPSDVSISPVQRASTQTAAAVPQLTSRQPSLAIEPVAAPEPEIKESPTKSPHVEVAATPDPEVKESPTVSARVDVADPSSIRPDEALKTTMDSIEAAPRSSPAKIDIPKDSNVSDAAPSPDGRAKTAPSPKRPKAALRSKSPSRPTSAGTPDTAKKGTAEPLLGSMAELKEEISKEEDFLKQVNALRSKVKEDINTWLIKFKNEHGREAAAADKEAIATKYKAFREATQLKENAGVRIKALKARYKEMKGPFEENK